MDNKKTAVLIPEEDIVVNFAVTDDKPFNKCFECRSFRNGCSGPNLFAMGIGRACEFLQMTRVFLKYSYQHVSDGTSISLPTVKRTLTGKNADPGYFTMKALSDFLVGDPNGKSPCAIPDIVPDDSAARMYEAAKELERALADNEDYRIALDNIHASYNAEMQIIREDAQKKIDYLVAQVGRLRIEVDNWHAESAQKSKIIDKLLDG